VSEEVAMSEIITNDLIQEVLHRNDDTYCLSYTQKWLSWCSTYATGWTTGKLKFDSQQGKRFGSSPEHPGLTLGSINLLPIQGLF
jgi:hypothetical protein